MTLREDMQAEPWRFDMLMALRRIERSFPERPRIGDSVTRAEALVRLGQDPYLEFPASNLTGVSVARDGIFEIAVRFLGLLGPQGALPLATTEEALEWLRAQDEAFPRFLDLFNDRFLQLFFRAWADARPIAHRDRPEADRFADYVGSIVGLGTPAMHGLDTVPDIGKLCFAGIAAPQARSASRLRRMIAGLFGTRVEIEEFIGMRLALEPGETTGIGSRNCRLGEDTIVGGSCFSVQDKFRIRLYVADLAQFERFLPTGDRCEPLTDFVFYYAGETLDWDVELALPSAAVEPMRLGQFGRVGWTTWLAPNWAADEDWRIDARFHPAEQMRLRRSLTP